MPTTGRRSGAVGAASTVYGRYDGYGRPVRVAARDRPGPRVAAPVGSGSGTIVQVAVVERVLGWMPEPPRRIAIKHRELVKFALVGGTTWVIDTVVFLVLKSTVLEPKPITAKIIAVLVATIVSYVLNREWSFRTRGGRERHHEAALFFVISGVGVAVYTAPLAISRYVFHLAEPARQPAHPGDRRLRQRPGPRRDLSAWRSAGGRSAGSSSRTRTSAARSERSPTTRRRDPVGSRFAARRTDRAVGS